MPSRRRRVRQRRSLPLPERLRAGRSVYCRAHVLICTLRAPKALRLCCTALFEYSLLLLVIHGIWQRQSTWKEFQLFQQPKRGN